MHHLHNHTNKMNQPKDKATVSAKSLWANLSDNQQESVNGGWPKIKWPKNGNGGGSTP